AQGALADIVALATTKMPLLARQPLATSPLFQRDPAAAATQRRAARSLTYSDADIRWAIGGGREALSPHDRAHIRATAAWATTIAASTAETAYHGGGGTAVYDASPLERRMRDVHAVTQHFLVRPDTFTTAGALLTGQEADVLVF